MIRPTPANHGPAIKKLLRHPDAFLGDGDLIEGRQLLIYRDRRQMRRLRAFCTYEVMAFILLLPCLHYVS